VGDVTKEILSWWEIHASKVGAWSEAARIAFAMAPNLAVASFRCSRSCSEATKTLLFPTSFACQLSSQVKLILSPKQRAKPAASKTRTCTNAAVCIASGKCPSRF
jgi:hypothetical protein